MGRVIAFSEFESYLREVRRAKQFSDGTILDTNVLIGLTYEVSAIADEVGEFFESCLVPLRNDGFRFFTTVNTRAEFLDFHRRRVMTEHLRDIGSGHSAVKLPEATRAQISYQSGQLKRREQQGGDPVFTDTQIKKIKSSCSAGRFSGHAGWLAVCDAVLAGCLDEAEEALAGFGVEYISQHEPDQRELFSRKIDWPEAKRISERSCVGLSDAMILNAFQCSRFPFVVSCDFDVGYAVLASPDLKDVVMPDTVAKKYRGYHFDG